MKHTKASVTYQEMSSQLLLQEIPAEEQQGPQEGSKGFHQAAPETSQTMDSLSAVAFCMFRSGKQPETLKSMGTIGRKRDEAHTLSGSINTSRKIAPCPP